MANVHKSAAQLGAGFQVSYRTGQVHVRSYGDTLTNAGQLAPYRCRGGRVEALPLPSFPLGLFPGRTFPSRPERFEPGDPLIARMQALLKREGTSLAGHSSRGSGSRPSTICDSRSATRAASVSPNGCGRLSAPSPRSSTRCRR